MCLRVCPRSRSPHRKKNYIKFLVRDFVNPLDVAWSVLKNYNPNVDHSTISPGYGGTSPRPMYEHLPDEAFMSRDKRVQMRRQAAAKEAMDRLLAETPGTELSQRELNEQRRAEEAMYPNPEQWLRDR